MNIRWMDEKLNLWCAAVKSLWMECVVIYKETRINQEKFPFSQVGAIILL